MGKNKKEKIILWFKEVDKDDGGAVGGKGANLGEMATFGIPVPDGFIVTRCHIVAILPVMDANIPARWRMSVSRSNRSP